MPVQSSSLIGRVLSGVGRVARLWGARRAPALESTPRPLPGPGRLLAFPERRSFGSRVKRWVGGLGLATCGVWWLLLTALLVMPDPATALDELFTSAFLPLVLVSLLLPLLFAVILRSGLRGPADPFVPDRDAAESARARPTPSSRVGRARGPTPAYARGGQKSHLRLVRDTSP